MPAEFVILICNSALTFLEKGDLVNQRYPSKIASRVCGRYFLEKTWSKSRYFECFFPI